jgi:hypothetical protein
MKHFAVCIFLLLAAAGVRGEPATVDGYPVANFALTVNAAGNGDFYGQILRNPGRLGEWLVESGSVAFFVEKDGKRHSFAGFGKKRIRRSFPFVENAYARSPVTAARIDVRTFCPLGVNDVQTSSLPVLLLEINCSAGRDEAFRLVIVPDSALCGGWSPLVDGRFAGAGDGRCRISCDTEAYWANGELSLPVSLQAGRERRLRILLAFHDGEWVSANRFPDVGATSDYAHGAWDDLREKTRRFGDAIPRTGDRELDEYLRWYMIPGISLTKCTSRGQVLTMGYRELNQRDSYWTSWLHLVLFRDAERRMIEESIEWQHPSGKIPTTILPLIERHDDLDINAFFILRAARYFRFHHDREALSAWWPALRRAMDWLVSRDTSADGLPVQVSFWGDWKDVRGVEGRKYSPFAGLVYLAALREMTYLSREMADDDRLRSYEQAFEKGQTFINRPTEQGGLWNGAYYCQRWKNGEVNDRLLQDQTVGILFGVVPPERAKQIVRALNARSLTPYGIAETSPCYPASFGYAPGTYHNGAVWPWLSFMDCWARIRIGRTREAVALVKRVARADLVASADWSPNEHINSLTGENLGFRLQGWNAGLFGLVYFGLVHPNDAPNPFGNGEWRIENGE